MLNENNMLMHLEMAAALLVAGTLTASAQAPTLPARPCR